MNIKGLFVWTRESVIRVVQLISTQKKLFVSYLSITWIMTHWILGNNRILTITPITWITRFLLFLVSINFAYTSRNPVSMGLRANASDKNPKPIYVIKRTSSLCEWLLQLVTQWLDQLDDQSSFVCVSISCITWINGSLIHFSKQIAPNKCQAYRMKVLSFTLFFLSLTLHYSVGFGQILIQILMKKLGIRIPGPSLSSAVEASIKPSIFHHN